ncbi:O-antigen ligase family protein [Sungkyunkwania multivorans]|uniref:O-antigen ligase family protein n=1 Tax=Sungkyunkwania multivorans TaxID=1173618 RepID=A0ABW3D209_9FLAO
MIRFKKDISDFQRELFLILVHVGLGVMASYFKPLMKLYFAVVFVSFLWIIIKRKNMGNIALVFCAYYVGGDTFFRMTGGTFFYEQVKYTLIIYILLAEYYKPNKQRTIIYYIYILLLIPGVFVAMNALDYETNLRKAIAFNLSGPVTLGIAAIHCYGRRVRFDTIKKILFYMGLPVISMTVYLFLYTPDLQAVITGTQSNFETSGGFGPNQVATVLGIGMFIFFVRYILWSPTLLWKTINAGLLAIMTFRALLTFSRGGVVTSVVMVALFLGMVYLVSTGRLKAKLIKVFSLLILVMLGTFIYSNFLSAGMLEKRYKNQDAIGRQKEDVTTGRKELIAAEIEAFNESPFFGIGVGKNKEYRYHRIGVMAASHNEVSRILAEHGMLGILAMAILFFVPLLRFLVWHRNIYMLSFFAFWFLTINHSSMRISAPAFIYGLSLLSIVNVKNSIHRKQLTKEGQNHLDNRQLRQTA